MKKKVFKKNKSTKKLLLWLILFVFMIVFGIAVFYFTANIVSQDNNNKAVQNTQQTKTDAILPPENYKDYTKYKFEYKYTIAISDFLNTLKFTLIVPQKEVNKQYFENLKINIKPAKIYKHNGNLISEFIYSDINKQNIEIVLSGNAYVRTYNLKTAKSLNIKPTAEEDLSRYLKSEPLIESDDEGIIQLAQEIQGNTREEILDNIYKFLQKNIIYKRISKDIGAKQALMGGFGKCSEYAAAMAALCRAKQIPARIVSGNFARENDTKHTWVEVYFDEYGWVTYDPTIKPTQITTVDQNGKTIKTEIKYETSHNNIHYIKSANNSFSTCSFEYNRPNNSEGTVSIKESIKIEKL